MNIWYFHHYATPETMPGLHRPYSFGKYFLSKGHNLSVFSASYLHYCDEQIIKEDVEENYIYKEDNGIQTLFIKTIGYKGSGLKRIINMFQFFFRLFPVAAHHGQKKKPDIIIASSPHPLTMVAGIKIAKRFDIPCVCEVRDFWPEVIFKNGRIKETSLVGRILLRGERWIYEKCNGLVFLKPGDYTYLLERKWDIDNGGKVDLTKCFYINNGVDLKTFEQNKKTYQLSRGKDYEFDFIVTYCGAIRKVNSVHLLVEAANYLKKGVVVEIYGTGDCLSELEQYIHEKGLTNVKLNGYVDNCYIPHILSKSSVNILNYSASKYNWSRGNSSNKLFEYLASGKPVISTVKMGYDILEEYSCGISTDECTSKSIADAINYIASLSKEEYSLMCVNATRAACDYDISNLADEYLSVVNNLCK